MGFRSLNPLELLSRQRTHVEIALPEYRTMQCTCSWISVPGEHYFWGRLSIASDKTEAETLQKAEAPAGGNLAVHGELSPVSVLK